jgi:hypothetical protein
MLVDDLWNNVLTGDLTETQLTELAAMDGHGTLRLTTGVENQSMIAW